jgi:hypothetical protein
MKSISNLCLHCGEPIKVGRSDKKFCDSECKNEYYNAIKVRERNEIRNIDIKLRKNRKILMQLFDPRKDTIVVKEKLISSGFDFAYHTHSLVTRFKQNEFIFCYDYGYREVEPGKFKIIEAYQK